LRESKRENKREKRKEEKRGEIILIFLLLLPLWNLYFTKVKKAFFFFPRYFTNWPFSLFFFFPVLNSLIWKGLGKENAEGKGM
jgi:hypothetical protein